MKRREWWASDVGVTLSTNGEIQEVRLLFSKLQHAKVEGKVIELVEADYCESLEREVAALRDGLARVSMGAVNDVDEAVSEVCKAILSADRIRDERESGEL